MAYVIGAPCVDCTDRSCIEQCPVDCIYEGSRKLYIHPGECIDCGACEAACPVGAITEDRSADPVFRLDSRRFFGEPLHGRADGADAAPEHLQRRVLLAPGTPLSRRPDRKNQCERSSRPQES